MLKNLTLAATALLLSLGVAEVATRAYLHWIAPEKVFKRYATLDQLHERYEPRVVPHRYLGYSLNPAFDNGLNRHNALGFRGAEITQPKPELEFRIVCLGGSTTYTLAVKDDQRTYPALLQTELQQRGYSHVTVVNAGVPGYSSWETLVNFQFRILDLSPDLIIVYHGVNDIHSRLVWPPAAYRGDNSGRSSPIELRSEPSLGDFSALARILLIRTGMAQPEAAFANSIDVRPDTYYGEEFMWQKRRKDYPAGIFEEVTAIEMLEANPPRFFRRNLENLVALADLHGVETVLATFAHSSRFRHRPRASSPEYVAAYEETNQVLRNLALDTSAHLYDFVNEFPKSKNLFTDGRHVTRAGAALKAELFAEFLTENDLISTSPISPDSPEP
jgi:lysophospholipase L1-like esterase